MLAKLGQQMLTKIGQQLFHTIETDGRQAGAHQQMFLTYTIETAAHTIAFCHAWPILLFGAGLAVIPLLPFIHFSQVSHYVSMLPLSFNTNYDGIIVLKESANRATILAKIFSYSPLLRSVSLFFFNDYTPC